MILIQSRCLMQEESFCCSGVRNRGLYKILHTERDGGDEDGKDGEKEGMMKSLKSNEFMWWANGELIVSGV
jgi:hypothetical protein